MFSRLAFDVLLLEELFVSRFLHDRLHDKLVILLPHLKTVFTASENTREKRNRDYLTRERLGEGGGNPFWKWSRMLWGRRREGRRQQKQRREEEMGRRRRRKRRRIIRSVSR